MGGGDDTVLVTEVPVYETLDLGACSDPGVTFNIGFGVPAGQGDITLYNSGSSDTTVVLGFTVEQSKKISFYFSKVVVPAKSGIVASLQSTEPVDNVSVSICANHDPTIVESPDPILSVSTHPAPPPE